MKYKGLFTIEKKKIVKNKKSLCDLLPDSAVFVYSLLRILSCLSTKYSSYGHQRDKQAGYLVSYRKNRTKDSGSSFCL